LSLLSLSLQKNPDRFKNRSGFLDHISRGGTAHALKIRNPAGFWLEADTFRLTAK
jgi:hypothetical protein